MFNDGYHDIIIAKLIPESWNYKILYAFKSSNTTNFTNKKDAWLRRLLSKKKIKLAVILIALSVIAVLVLTILSKLFSGDESQRLFKKTFLIKTYDLLQRTNSIGA